MLANVSREKRASKWPRRFYLYVYICQPLSTATFALKHINVKYRNDVDAHLSAIVTSAEAHERHTLTNGLFFLNIFLVYY